MDGSQSEGLSQVLRAAAEGDPSAAQRLLPLVYEELRRLAAARMARLPPGQTLQPTALVHEAYLRVFGGKRPSFESRRHFYFVVCRAMRDILVEHARRKDAVKRGRGRRRNLSGLDELYLEPPHENMLDLDRALQKLEQHSPEQAQVVQLRFFTGLSNHETADILGLSIPTVERRWRYARAWLRRELSPPSPAPA